MTVPTPSGGWLPTKDVLDSGPSAGASRKSGIAETTAFRPASGLLSGFGVTDGR